MRKFTQSWQTNWNKKLSKYVPVLAVIVVFGGLGTAFLLNTHAATPTASSEAENGTVSSAASKVSDTTASAGQTIKFGSGSAQTLNCAPAANATMTNTVSHLCGFADITNTGPPPGTNFVTVNDASTDPPNASLPTDNHGWHWSPSRYYGIYVDTDGAVVDGVKLNNGGEITIVAKNVTIMGDSLLLGGVFTLGYSIIRGFGTDNTFRFLLVATGLIVAMIIGYLKFIRPLQAAEKSK